MTVSTDWLAQNEAYLRLSLQWLRLRLERHIALSDALATPDLLERIEDQLAVVVQALQVAQSASDGAQPALVTLAQRLNLSPFEEDVLVLCTSVELDPGGAALCAIAQGDSRLAYPTFALALALFDDPAWDALSPIGGLRRWRLIEITQPAGQPLVGAALRADERIVSYLKGLSYLDDRLSPFMAPLELSEPRRALASSQRAAVDQVVRNWGEAAGDGGAVAVVQLVGPDPLSKQLVAYHAAADLQRRVYRAPAELLPTSPADIENLSVLWRRESILSPVALYIEADDIELSAAAPGLPLSRFLARSSGAIVLGVRAIWPAAGPAQFAVEVNRPTVPERQAAWDAALKPGMRESAARLAGQFELNVPTIQALARAARAETADDDDEAFGRSVWDACRASTRPRLDTLAQRVDAKATWNDLVLPDTELDLLRQIVAQAGQRTRVYEEWGFAQKMSRGWGISALFAGDSGTGKTMAAEVIATSLRLDLYRIDLSGVVSKYIGETEKNLARLFDVAEGGGGILFFDEADALFGKRSEVKDSHDRYANIEVNYLLQRMETYRGLAILATNVRSALDPAFLRRLRFIVTFPFPDTAQRAAIWENVFPELVDTAGLDFQRLAQLQATGGMIFNVALNAAFVAASAGRPVTMDLVLNSARAEFAKHERPMPERVFAMTP